MGKRERARVWEIKQMIFDVVCFFCVLVVKFAF